MIDSATRDVIRAEVARRMAGSKSAQQHTHIECNCPDLKHRRAEYDIGCFCPSCASKAAVKLGYPATDTSPEAPGEDDNLQFCQDCGALITTEGLTADGINEELDHWRANPKRPQSADEWLEFSLCLAADPPRRDDDPTDEETWEKNVAVMMRETPPTYRVRWWLKGKRKLSRAKRKSNRASTNGGPT